MIKSLSNIRIAIVDDELSIVTMLQMVLCREGFHQLYAALTCAEALDLAERTAPDIILLGIMLPYSRNRAFQNTQLYDKVWGINGTGDDLSGTLLESGWVLIDYILPHLSHSSAAVLVM